MSCSRRYFASSGRRKLVLLFSCVALTLAAFLYGFYLREKCTETLSKEIFVELCNLYKSKHITGDLCPSLCSGRQEWKYNDCFFRRSGGKVVILMEHSTSNNKVILKAKNRLLSAVLNDSYGTQNVEEDVSENVKALLSFVTEQVNVDLDVGLTEEELTDSLWFTNIENTLGDNPDWAPAVYRSLQALFAQDEYRFLKFVKSKHLPQLSGSCGHFYAVEYLPSGDFLKSGFNSMVFLESSWKERSRLALKFIEMVEHFDTSSIPKLKLCDVKGDNFGLSPKTGNLKPIDLDMIFGRPSLLRNFALSKCQTHADCDFFDCLGQCDSSTNQCLDIIANDNMQAICSIIFLGRHSTGTFSGLLSNAPNSIRGDLLRSLELCSTVSSRRDYVRVDESTIQTIRQLLLGTL